MGARNYTSGKFGRGTPWLCQRDEIFQQRKSAPGHAQLYINEEVVGEIEIPYTTPLVIGPGSGMTVGRNPGSPVSRAYQGHFAFTGNIGYVTADLSGSMIEDTDEAREAFTRMAMARQ